MKRFLAVLLCLVMLFSLAPYSAFAEGEEQEASATEQVNEKTEEETKQEETVETSAEETKQEESAAESEQPAESETPVNEESAVAEPAAEESAATEEVASEEETPKLTANLEDNSVCKIGETGYESVADAFSAAAKASESEITIKMVADSTEKATLKLDFDKSITLDLAGHMLSTDGNRKIITVSSGSLTIDDTGKGGNIAGNGKTSINGQGINIIGSGVVDFKGGTILGCTATTSTTSKSYGGGVYVGESATFTLEGGIISGCSATTSSEGNAYGGGVYVDGTFNMTSGSITGCSAATNGGGVYVASSGKFTMNGGTITGCTAASGAGIYTLGTTTITGGTIYSNTATGNGGGIRVNSGTTSISGGEFYSNKSSSSNTFLKSVSKSSSATFNFTGGWFSGKVYSTYVPAEYTATGKCTDASNTSAAYTISTGYKITYMNGTTTLEEVSKNAGDTVILSDPSEIPDGKGFGGWCMTAQLTDTPLSSGTEVEFSKDVTLYAKWNDVVAKIGNDSYGTLKAAFDAAATSEGNQTIQLVADCELTTTIEISAEKTITLDLKNHKIDAKNARRFFKLSGGSLVLTDSSGDKGGQLCNGNATGGSGGAVWINNASSTFSMQGGTISNCTASSNGGAVMISSGAFEMTGGTITGCSKETGYGDGVRNADGTFTMTGGTIICDEGKKLISSSSSTGVSTSVTGGWFSDEVDVPEGYNCFEITNPPSTDAPYTVSNTIGKLKYDANTKNHGDESTLTVTEKKDIPYLSGYNSKIKLTTATPDGEGNYIFKSWNTESDGTGSSYTGGQEDADFIPDDNGEMTLYAIYEESTDYVVKTDTDDEYVTFNKAIRAAGTTKTELTPLKDTEERISVAEGQNITINLTYDITTSKNTGSSITNKGTLTIKGNKTISGTAGSSGGAIDNQGTLTIEGGTITGKAPTKGGAIVNTGTLTIKGGSISGEITGESGSGGGIHNSGTLTVEGGTIDGNAPSYGGAIYNSGTVTLTGGTIKGTAGKKGSSIYTANGDTTVEGDINSLTITGADVKVYGSVESGDTQTSVSLSAGSYRIKPAETYLAENCKFVEVEDTECRYQVVSATECYVVSLQSVGADRAYVSGGGCIAKGSNAKAVAPQLSGYTFKGWFKDYDAEAVRAAESTSYTYVFTPVEDTDLTAVYESEGETPSKAKYQVSINSPVKVGDVTYETGYNGWVESGTELKVTYNGEGTFKYWADSNTGNSISEENPYTFEVSKHVFLTAVTSAESGSRVIYYSSYGQIVDSATWTEDTKADFKFTDKQPSVLGKTFAGWSKDSKTVDEDAVKDLIGTEGNEVISLYPVYGETETCTVTVKYIGTNRAEQKYENQSIGELCTVSVELGENETVVWKDSNGNALSEKLEYTFIPTGDCTLYAVCGESIDYSVSIADKSASMNGETYFRISITEAYFVKYGYSVVDTGFLMTKDEDSKDDMLVGAEGINVFRCSNTSRDGRYTLNLNTKVQDRTYYVRAYMTYKDDSGNTYTVYTDVADVSYKSIKGE